jgi:putative PIN family toxin of toxin-antitoxin system
MRVVLDTNVILRAVSPESAFAGILDELYEGRFALLTTSEILLEYEEKFVLFYGREVATFFLDFLLLLPNVTEVTPHYKFNFIVADMDDNKFVDCAFAGNAHFIVTDDKHFNSLAKIKFPKIKVIKAINFLEIIVAKYPTR